METRVSRSLSIKFLQSFSVAWQALSVAFVAILLPKLLFPIGVTASLIALILAAAAVLQARSTLAWLSTLDAWTVFFGLLVSQALSGTIGQYLPITLLQFIMILFAVELLTASCSYEQRSSIEHPQTIESDQAGSHTTSAQQVFRNVSRSGLLFAGCYLLSLGSIFLGELTAVTIPLLAEISLYLVVVSVSLALLLVLREEHGQS